MSNKRIYRNKFDGLNQGVHVQGDNGLNDPDNSVVSGLTIQYNDFGQLSDPNDFDIRLIGPYFGLNTDINPNHGALMDLTGIPAGNRFSNSELEDNDISVNTSNNSDQTGITYYHTSDPQSTPDSYTIGPMGNENIWTDPIELDETYSDQTCPQNVFIETLDLIVDFESYYDEVVLVNEEDEGIVKDVYQENLDKGDIQGLSGFINNPVYSSFDVRNEMLSCVPYISLESWKAAFTRSPSMDPWHLSQVLLESSPLKAEVQKMMTTYDLDPFYRQLVLEGQNGGVSNSSILLNEIATFGLNADIAKGVYGRGKFMLDENEDSHLDSLLTRLLSDDEATNKDVATLQIAMGNFNEALSTLSSCYDLEGNFDNECRVLQIMAESFAANGLGSVLNVHKDELEAIANSMDPGYSKARALLYATYDEFDSYWPSDIIDHPNPRSFMLQNDEAADNFNSFLSINPNPATSEGFMMLHIPQGSEAMLLLYDSQGRIAYSKSGITGIRIESINASKLNSGIYLCTLYIDGIQVSKDKWLIQH